MSVGRSDKACQDWGRSVGKYFCNIQEGHCKLSAKVNPADHYFIFFWGLAKARNCHHAAAYLSCHLDSLLHLSRFSGSKGSAIKERDLIDLGPFKVSPLGLGKLLSITHAANSSDASSLVGNKERVLTCKHLFVCLAGTWAWGNQLLW